MLLKCSSNLNNNCENPTPLLVRENDAARGVYVAANRRTSQEKKLRKNPETRAIDGELHFFARSRASHETPECRGAAIDSAFSSIVRPLRPNPDCHYSVPEASSNNEPPASIFCCGLNRSVAPKRWAVVGISCIKPPAPLRDSAPEFQLDSV